MSLRFRARLSCIAVGSALSLAAITAQARDFSGVYVFGDSLSDAGAFTNLVGALGVPSANRFTTNPGSIWAETLAATYGRTAATAYAVNPLTGMFGQVAAGTNFAVGGARTNAQPGVFPASEGIAANIPPVSSQVSTLLARGALDGQALYAVWAGANDVFTQMGMVGAVGASAVPTAMAALTTAATDLTAQISRLKSAGAKNIVVIGVPDIGATPFAVSGGAAQVGLATMLTSTYNTALAQSLNGSGVLYFDGPKLFQAILANPAAYGITNTAIPACGASSSLGCTAAANGALFADGVHPSTLGHQIVADWVRATLEGTGRAGLLAALPIGRSGAQWRSVDGRMREFQNFGSKGGGVFVSLDRAPGGIDATATSSSASGHSSGLTVGYERALGQQWLIGAALGYEEAPFDLGNNAGRIKYDEWNLTAFASFKSGPWYVNGLASHGRLDYTSSRNFNLGPLAVAESGDTKGRQNGFRLQAGYLMNAGAVLHGPLAGVDWERVTVDGYSEKSGSASALSFGQQERKALRSRVGYQVAGEDQWGGMRARPYAQFSYEYQHKKDERDTLVGFAGSSMMAVPTSNRTGGYGVLAVGTSLRVSKDIDLGVGLMGTLGQPGGRNSALQVTLNMPL
jgi:outer membrane lipase/esterase